VVQLLLYNFPCIPKVSDSKNRNIGKGKARLN